MSRKLHYTPCQCDFSKTDCFDCAVDMVIMEMGWSIYCTCIQTRSEHCGNCSLFRQFQQAFSMAETPYGELARARLETTGRVYSVDLLGVFWGRQDPDRAVDILLSEVDSDPISHKAALLLFRDLTKRNRAVPKPLQLFVSDFICDVRPAPKLRGKYPNAHKERDREIFRLIQQVVSQTGLKATSGNHDTGRSACHAVARALNVLSLLPHGYEAIRKIWFQRQDLSEIDTSWGV
jgi:hypothetical protein